MSQTTPKLSIIVPSYNQGEYIEETILSIINQDYPGKELIIIDGGSTDNSVEIIKKYEQHIAYWVSEKDEGQAHAINKGFERATGDYIAWMNSDDTYYENAFAKIFSLSGIEQYDFIFGGVQVGSHPAESIYFGRNKNKKLTLYNLLHFFYSPDYIIPSQSVFVRKAFIEKKQIGFLNNDCHYCMDMEWYCRIALADSKCFVYDEALSFFRKNDTTKTGSQKIKMHQEAIEIFYKYKGYLNEKQQQRLFNLLFLDKLLRLIYKKKSRVSIGKLFKIISKIPAEALNDKRFLGVCRKSLFA